MGKLKYIVSFGIILVVWQVISLFMGSVLVPPPLTIIIKLGVLVSASTTWEHILISVFRGILGLSITFILAIPAGLAGGLSKKLMDLTSPLVTASQSCPPIIWIAILMVWVGMGAAVPLVVIVLTLFPVIFFNIANGVASIDKDLFHLARIYRIKKRIILKDIILPGINSSLIASFSYALGVTWKVIATAEFFGSSNGIGSRLYWSFRYLEIPDLYSWALILILMGFFLEVTVIDSLRRRNTSQEKSTDD